MALRWKDTGLGVLHGYLGGVRMFQLLAPKLPGGQFTLSADLPGAAAGALVSRTFDTAPEAQRRAHQFVSAWLERHREELETEPDPADGVTWWEHPDATDAAHRGEEVTHHPDGSRELGPVAEPKQQYWVISRGAYEDHRVVGVVASEADTKAVEKLTDDRDLYDYDTFRWDGPFTLGVITEQKYTRLSEVRDPQTGHYPCGYVEHIIATVADGVATWKAEQS